MSLTRKALDCVEAVAPYVAEFIGTYLVVFACGCNKVAGDPNWAPTAIAFAVMVGMYAAESASGGHLNPALTLSFGFAGKMRWKRILGYIIAQVAGGLLAGLTVTKMLNTTPAVTPRKGYDVIDAGIVEVFYSTLTCFVALNCMVSSRNNPATNRSHFYGLAVGFTIIAGGHNAEDVSGGFFNPAISLAYGLHSMHWSDMGLYLAFQVVGAFAAAILFLTVRPEELRALGHQVAEDSFNLHKALFALPVCSICWGSRGKKKESSAHFPSLPTATEAGPPDDRHDGTSLEDGVSSYGPVPRSLVPQGHADRAKAFATRLVSEFIGTYVIVFTFGLGTVFDAIKAREGSTINGAGAQSHSLKDVARGGYFGLNVEEPFLLRQREHYGTVAWASGAATLVMVYALGNISCHFNPAVTLGVVFSGREKCSFMEGLCLIAMQGAAALTAVITYTLVHARENPRARVMDLGPRPGFNWGTVALCEVFFTMGITLIFLCMTTLRSLVYTKAPQERCFQLGLAVGMSVTAAGIALDSITGGYLNPAISFGVSVENFYAAGWSLPMPDGGDRARYFLWYAIWEGLGGIVAAMIFTMLHPREYKVDYLLRGQALPDVYAPDDSRAPDPAG